MISTSPESASAPYLLLQDVYPRLELLGFFLFRCESQHAVHLTPTRFHATVKCLFFTAEIPSHSWFTTHCVITSNSCCLSTSILRPLPVIAL